MEGFGKLAVSAAFLVGVVLSAGLFLATGGFASPALAQIEVRRFEPASLPEPQPISSETTDALRDAEDGDCQVSSRYSEKIRQWCGLITSYGLAHDLDPDLLAALILEESGGDPEAYSHSGAVGLMQVMPSDGLAEGFMCAGGPCFRNRPTTAELLDPEYNIAYGTKMLSDLVKRTGSLREALKSYGPMDVGYSYSQKVLAIYERNQN